MLYKNRTLCLVVTLLLAALGLYTTFSALAAPAATTHTVCASGCDYSSIQAAINAATPGDTLDLAAETFTEQIVIDRDLTIQGQSAQTTIVQADTAPGIASDRVIAISAGATVTIKDITVRFGKTTLNVVPDGYGGGILNEGTLHLSRSIIISNTAQSGGGGIYNRGNCSATITDSTIEGNSATTGAGIHNYNNCTVSVSNSTFIRNSAANVGGGMANDRESTTIISSSRFEENSAAGGGGLYNIWDSKATVANCTFLANQADSGAGIRNYAVMTVTGNLFELNVAGGAGGGINNYQYAELAVSTTVFDQNRADFGGGIYNYNHGVLAISNSTFFSNHATHLGGGLQNDWISTAAITGTTFQSNTTGATGYGGGIFNDDGSLLTLLNSTFSGNGAGQMGGAIHNDNVSTITSTHVTLAQNSAGLQGQSISNEYFAVLYLENSILSGNPAGGECYVETGDYQATIIDLGYNIDRDGTCTAAGTSFSGDPKLDALQDNGGDTLTHALLATSPALDAIPANSCVVTQDQRGVPRPQGSGCDIGAYEVGVVPPPSYDLFIPAVIKQ